MIRWVNTWCEEYATWVDRHMTNSAIGYPSQTAEQAQIGSGNASSICPEVMMTGRVAQLDRILNAQHQKWRRLFDRHYIERRPKKHGGYYVDLDRLHNRIEAVWENSNNR